VGVDVLGLPHALLVTTAEVGDRKGAEVQIAKRNGLHKFAVIPKRWVVERSFAWLDNYRRLWKNCERKLDTSLQMTTMAFVALLLKRWRC
jgi:transposase